MKLNEIILGVRRIADAITRSQNAVLDSRLVGHLPRFLARVSINRELLCQFGTAEHGSSHHEFALFNCGTELILRRLKPSRAVGDTQPRPEMEWRHDSARKCGQYEASNEADNHVKRESSVLPQWREWWSAPTPVNQAPANKLKSPTVKFWPTIVSCAFRQNDVKLHKVAACSRGNQQ